MANKNAVMGFIPVRKLDGSVIPVWRYYVSSSSSTNMFVGDLVSEINGGYVSPSAANCGTILVGAVTAIYDTNYIPAGAPGGSVTTKYLPASTAGYVDIALAVADAVFRTQIATAASTNVNASANHVQGTGSTVTGLSGHYLGTATTGNANFKIIGKVDDPSNAWGANVDVLVVPLESVWRAAGSGV